MGEERSGKSDAIRKGRERARGVDDESVATLAKRASSPASTTGEVKTAYKRGGPRPWEVARAASEAKAASPNPGRGREPTPTPTPRTPRVPPSPARVCRAHGERHARRGLEAHDGDPAPRHPAPRRRRRRRRSRGDGERKDLRVRAADDGRRRRTRPGGTKVQGRCCPSMIVLVPNVELGRQVAYMAELAAEWVDAGSTRDPRFSRCWEKTRSSSNPRRRARGARRRRRRSSVRFRRRPPSAPRAWRPGKPPRRPRGARAPRTRKPPPPATPPRISRGVEPRPTSPGAPRRATRSRLEEGVQARGDREVIPEFRRAEVLVATPARLLAMMRDGWVLPGRISHVVVDEADGCCRGGSKERWLPCSRRATRTTG